MGSNDLLLVCAQLGWCVLVIVLLEWIQGWAYKELAVRKRESKHKTCKVNQCNGIVGASIAKKSAATGRRKMSWAYFSQSLLSLFSIILPMAAAVKKDTAQVFIFAVCFIAFMVCHWWQQFAMSDGSECSHPNHGFDPQHGGDQEAAAFGGLKTEVLEDDPSPRMLSKFSIFSSSVIIISFLLIVALSILGLNPDQYLVMLWIAMSKHHRYMKAVIMADGDVCPAPSVRSQSHHDQDKDTAAPAHDAHSNTPRNMSEAHRNIDLEAHLRLVEDLHPQRWSFKSFCSWYIILASFLLVMSLFVLGLNLGWMARFYLAIITTFVVLTFTHCLRAKHDVTTFLEMMQKVKKEEDAKAEQDAHERIVKELEAQRDTALKRTEELNAEAVVLKRQLKAIKAGTKILKEKCRKAKVARKQWTSF